MFLFQVTEMTIYMVLGAIVAICIILIISSLVKIEKNKKQEKDQEKPVVDNQIKKEEIIKPIVVKEGNVVKAEVKLADKETSNEKTIVEKEDTKNKSDEVKIEKLPEEEIKKNDILNPTFISIEKEKANEEIAESPSIIVTEDIKVKQETSERRYVGKYEIFKEGEYFKYRLKASNGEVLCVSEIYSSEKGCFEAIENVKKNLSVGTITIGSDKNGLYTFTLKAKNGRPLIVSANYSTKERVESAMNSFKRFANTSIVNVIDEVKESAFLNEMEKIEPQSVDNEYNGKFVVIEKDSKYSYVLKASNGVILCRSDEYITKLSCLNAIQVLKNAIEKGTFYLAQDKRNQFQFKLYSDKNRLIIVGESYTRKSSALSAINSVKKFYLNAKIVEEVQSEAVVER